MQRKSTVFILLSSFSTVQCKPFAKDSRIGRVQDVIWNAFLIITSKAFVPALLPPVLVLSTH